MFGQTGYSLTTRRATAGRFPTFFNTTQDLSQLER